MTAGNQRYGAQETRGAHGPVGCVERLVVDVDEVDVVKFSPDDSAAVEIADAIGGQVRNIVGVFQTFFEGLEMTLKELARMVLIDVLNPPLDEATAGRVAQAIVEENGAAVAQDTNPIVFRAGADVIVNTDADNQYQGTSIPIPA